MDGVLVNAEDLMAQATVTALREFGIETSPCDFIPYIGAGEEKYLSCPVKAHGGVYVPEMKVRAYEIYTELLGKTPEAVVPDVKAVLTKLKKRVKIALCSSADTVKVRINLAAMGVTPDFFNAVVTGNDITRNKPEPDIYLKGAELVGVEPRFCLVAEDAVNGIHAAHAAGMRCAGITTSFTAETLTREASPEYLIPHISGLESIINETEQSF